MKKVLVTGADGFIGSHLTESLLAVSYTHLDVYKRQTHTRLVISFESMEGED